MCCGDAVSVLRAVPCRADALHCFVLLKIVVEIHILLNLHPPQRKMVIFTSCPSTSHCYLDTHTNAKVIMIAQLSLSVLALVLALVPGVVESRGCALKPRDTATGLTA